MPRYGDPERREEVSATMSQLEMPVRSLRTKRSENPSEHTIHAEHGTQASIDCRAELAELLEILGEAKRFRIHHGPEDVKKFRDQRFTSILDRIDAKAATA